MSPRELYIGGRARRTADSLAVHDKHTSKILGHVCMADEGLTEEATEAAVRAEPMMAAMRRYQRAAVLERVVDGLTARAAEIVELLIREGGKTRRDAESELSRAQETFRIAARMAYEFRGESLPLDQCERTQDYRAESRQVPVGACLFITPFNFPLNLVAHKVAPAIAAGCPFVLKPASLTPMSALLLGEILAESGLPEGAFSILPCSRTEADKLVPDERFKLLSFTGSAAVGWSLKQRAGRKKVVLELGGNAACIIDADADMASVVPRLVQGAFYQAGQSCISVQRIYIHASIYEPCRDRLISATQALRAGDPWDEKTFIGPLIQEQEALRVSRWMEDAQKGGGRLLCGGERRGAYIAPALMENVPLDSPLMTEEVFGPLAVLIPFTDHEQVFSAVNASPYGLQAGIFTFDVRTIEAAWRSLKVGAVIVNDVPSFRADNMPYGGVKASGLGREGILYAMQEMSEMRLLVILGESALK